MKLTVQTILLCGALAGSAMADAFENELSRLRLLPRAHVRGRALLLSDVLDFSQADPRLLEAVGEKAVAEQLAAPARTEITHQQVVQRLSELGVNMGRVLLNGALDCQVTLEEAPVTPECVHDAPSAPLLRGSADIEGAGTLRDTLRTQLEDELGSQHGTVELEFEHAAGEFLDLTSPPFEFVIRGNRGATLGLREFNVTLRRDGRTQRTVHVGVRVKLIKKVLVAAKPLNAGTYVKRESLDFATRVFTDDSDLGLEYPEQVIGQRVSEFIPAGQMIRENSIKTVDLVRRSQPVTVTGGENVSIRLNGEALESGGYGETIRVRVGHSRNNRREVRAIITGVGTVRLVEGRI